MTNPQIVSAVGLLRQAVYEIGPTIELQDWHTRTIKPSNFRRQKPNEALAIRISTTNAIQTVTTVKKVKSLADLADRLQGEG
ncbi:MAG: hypothetical protein WC348_01020 [Patescibacteria group bacterium]|jgi:hypothetical protein